ncbi:HAD family hydrolase [Pseudotenacibaculum sp. MALMAid0570]|uniref:HAD family hydrolase n=1 Tax=Pseudotenacibaculum sp. MALMAid0570 TaxID=3143938 RepID=UPI0032DFAD58
MNYKCIIFDCDGVLVDSETISNQVVVDLANSYGANITLEYAIQHFAGTSLSYVKSHIEELIQQDLPDNFEKDYRRISFERFQQDIQPIQGITELLDELTIPFCVASNGPLNKMKLNLELTGLLHYFKGNLFSAYEIKKWKPDPTLFLYAAKTMGFQPKDCLVIEDSISGIKAAKSGGFDVFAFTNKHKKEVFEKENVPSFSSMKAIRDALK